MVCGREKLDRRIRRKTPAFGGRLVAFRQGSRLGTVTEDEARVMISGPQEIWTSVTQEVDVDHLMEMLEREV